MGSIFSPLVMSLSGLSAVNSVGRVQATDNGTIQVRGLSGVCRLGDRVTIYPRAGCALRAEVLHLGDEGVSVLPGTMANGIALGDKVVPAVDGMTLYPDDSWVGRVLDASGRPLDGRGILPGPRPQAYLNTAPPAADRRDLGPRLETGITLFNTILPIVRGQRVGLFAGSGVGKTTLIGRFARQVEADVTVIALVGERGRELREFTDRVLGSEGLRRSVVIVATSDMSPLEKRRAAWGAVAVAEYFRDRGKHVLLIVDSITRFAEAHREVALAAGEPATMRGFPPSTAQLIMSLCERTGPGAGGAGDITAIFSVLVAGSDMDEPIADIVRGVLDGHVVLDRGIAEEGRFPAVDVLRSVSRSLPRAATAPQNAMIGQTRKALSVYESARLMVQSGLYVPGSDAEIDHAISVRPRLERFFSTDQPLSIEASFAELGECLSRPQGKDQVVDS